MTPFQVDVGEQSVCESAKGPDTVMPLTETPVVPVFVTQTSLSALVVPPSTEAKAMLLGDRDTAADDGGGGGGDGGGRGSPQAPLSVHAVAADRESARLNSSHVRTAHA